MRALLYVIALSFLFANGAMARPHDERQMAQVLCLLVNQILPLPSVDASVDECRRAIQSDKSFDVSLLYADDRRFIGNNWYDERSLHYRLFMKESDSSDCDDRYFNCLDVSLLYADDRRFIGNNWYDERSLHYRTFVKRGD